MRNIKFLLVSVLFGLNACSYIDDFAFGKDNSLKPAKLPLIKQARSIDIDWKVYVGQSADAAVAPDLQPMIWGNEIYVLSSKGHLLALSKQRGQILWKTQLPSGVLAGPLVHNQELIVNSDKASVYILNRVNGHLQKEIHLSSDALAKPLLVGQNLYVKTINGFIYAINLQTAKKDWSYEQGAPDIILKASSSPVYYRGQIVAGFSDGSLVGFDAANGHLQWQRHLAFPKGSSDVERLVDIDTTPIIEDDHLYIASYQGEVALYALDSEEFIWHRPASTYHDLAVVSDYLVLVDSQDTIWLLDKNNGNVLWKQNALKGRRLTAPVIWNHQIWVGDAYGVMHGLELKTGNFIGQVALSGHIVSAAVVDKKGCYVLNTNGYLYRLSMRT